MARESVTLLAASGLRIERGGTAVLEEVSFTVGRGDRWGVVGRNGVGKTSLFQVITGQLATAGGALTRAPDLQIALLDQERDTRGAETVWEVVADPFAELLALGRALESQAGGLAADASPEALARYDHDLERFRREGGYEIPARVDRLLEGLGFDPRQARARSPASLSGGERGRLGLARQLARPADLYLMDEPTNHLDLETSRWLEAYLASLDAAVLVVSHDRAFLDAVADHVLHLEAGRAHVYRCGYLEFVGRRAEAREARRRAVARQQAEISAEEEYIRRNLAGQNSRQARGRRTRLERLPRLAPPPTEEDVLALRLAPGQRGGDQVLVLEDLEVAAGGRALIGAFNATVRRGEKVAVIGPNGAGKTTLLHTLLAERTPAGGRARLGVGIEAAHFRQDLSTVDPQRSVFDLVYDRRPRWDRGQVQGHLGRFRFEGEEVQRRAGTLSGGETARLALALLMLSRANLLVLDEPTNHLDVESIEVLEDALRVYRGTVLLVSHDRALLRSVTTRVWALAGGRIHDFPGSFADWEVRTHQAPSPQTGQVSSRRWEGTGSAVPGPAQLHRAQRKARRADRRSALRAVASAEARVHELEQCVAEAETALARPELYTKGAGLEQAGRLAAELDRLRADLEKALVEWEEETEALAALPDAED